MPKTFLNTPLTVPGWHRVKTEQGHYILSPYWIDTVVSSDMMDYDFTASLPELYKQCRERHVSWCKDQVPLHVT